MTERGPDLLPTVSYGTTYQNPWDVAANASTLYWTESAGATVWSAPLGGGGAAPLPVVMGQSGCDALAANASGFYWVASNQVRTFISNAATTIGVGTATSRPFSLAADASGVYWLTLDGTLQRWRSGAAGAVKLADGFAAAFTELHIQAIALTTEHIVWITSDGRLLRLAK